MLGYTKNKNKQNKSFTAFLTLCIVFIFYKKKCWTPVNYYKFTI